MATKPKASKTKLNIDKLTEALAPDRARYYDRVRGFHAEDAQKLLAKLAEDGMDSQITFHYPESNKYPSVERYRRQKAVYDLCNQLTNGDEKRNGYARGFNDPNFRVVKPQAEIDALIDAKAKKDTEQYFDGWIMKLAVKIGSVVTEASVVGNLWMHSILTVKVEDGSTQVWKTQCIINRSIYNKLFNQFPTRRQS